jgi:hypothetical protein
MKACEPKKRWTNPAVLHGLPPALAVLTDTNDDIEAVVTSVQALTVTLRTISDQSKCVVLEVVLEPGKRPVGALVYNLFSASKVERLHSPSRDCLDVLDALASISHLRDKNFHLQGGFA